MHEDLGTLVPRPGLGGSHFEWLQGESYSEGGTALFECGVPFHCLMCLWKCLPRTFILFLNLQRSGFLRPSIAQDALGDKIVIKSGR